MDKLGIVICYYNTPENTDSLVEFIKSNFRMEYNLLVVDNGSNPEMTSKYTDITLMENRNKLGGLLVGMQEIKLYQPSLYWNISSSTSFIDFGEDFSLTLSNALREVPDAVAITPGYTGEVVDATNKENLAIEDSIVHESKLMGAYAMWDAEWLDLIGWFDPRLTSTFGTDFETAFLARNYNKKFLVHDKARILVKKGPAYKAGRAGISLDDYQRECIREMEMVFIEKYGMDWRKILGVEQYV